MNDLPRGFKHATVWLLLALGIFLAVQHFIAGQRATRFVVDGGTIELRRGLDGHYHWPGRINGRAVDFLVDTGATGTAIPRGAGARARSPGRGAREVADRRRAGAGRCGGR